MKTIFRKLCSLLALVALLSSCVKDHQGIDPDTGGDLNVILKLDLPGGFIPANSRSLTIGQENAVEDLTVFVFDNNNLLVDLKQGRPVSGTTWGVTVAQSVDEGQGNPTFNLVVVANAESLIKSGVLGFDDFRNITGAIGKSEAEVRAALVRYVDAKMYAGSEQKAIPMWGQTGPGEIDRRNPNRSVSLIRSLSRIDVGVGTSSGSNTAGYTWDGLLDDGAKFDLQSVIVMRPNEYISILPNSANISASHVATAVSIPTNPTNAEQWSVSDSKTKFTYSAIGGQNYITQQIYVPESDIKKGSPTLGGVSHVSRMAIVVGGSYMDGATTYYRLDFAQNNALIDVLRNHIYQFNISKVAGPGYPTPEEAYSSLSMNMIADIVDWNGPSIGDIVFDGQYHFGIESRNVVFPASGGSRSLAITTNQSWTLTGSSMFTYNPTTGTASNGNLTITAGSNAGGTRTETVTITAGRNKITVNVTQLGQRTLNFDSQSGSTVNPITVGGGTQGSSISWPASPTLTGKKFGGWYTTAAGDGIRVDGNSQWTMPDADATVFARWVDDATPTVVFDFQGGHSGTTFVVKPSSGTVMPTATAPQHDYDLFQGYFTAVNEAGDKYYEANMSGVRNWDFTAQSTTLYAHWLKRYQLTYWDGFGGKIVLPSVHNAGATITPPATPTKTGYDFKAWSKTHPFNISDHTDVTALWDVQLIKATWTTDGGTPATFPDSYVPYSKLWRAPEPAPGKPHYNFIGWIDTKTPAAREQIGTEAKKDADFKAIWTIKTYTMNLHLGGGWYNGSQTAPPISRTYPNKWPVILQTIGSTTYSVHREGYASSQATTFTNGQAFNGTATNNCTATFHWKVHTVTLGTCYWLQGHAGGRWFIGNFNPGEAYPAEHHYEWYLPRIFRTSGGEDTAQLFEWIIKNQHGDVYVLSGVPGNTSVPINAIGGTLNITISPYGG